MQITVSATGIPDRNGLLARMARRGPAPRVAAAGQLPSASASLLPLPPEVQMGLSSMDRHRRWRARWLVWLAEDMALRGCVSSPDEGLSAAGGARAASPGWTVRSAGRGGSIRP